MTGMNRRKGPPALVAVDVAAVVVFAAIGRASHDEALLGVLGTAAPFLAGAVIGGLIARSWRAPLSWRSGTFTWVGAAGIGLALRFALYDRLPFSFVVVATVSLAVLVLGWRGVARLITGTGRRRRVRLRA